MLDFAHRSVGYFLVRPAMIGLPTNDNSAAERTLRGVAIGRRNYPFAVTAVIYSLIGTVKLNGVDPEAWLRHVRACSDRRPSRQPR